MTGPDIATQRLHNQRLEGAKWRTPGEVVSWLGAVQAQEYGPAKWGLGLRMEQATDAAVEEAYSGGEILRTHVMRPTWHFVTPADIRWLQALTAPRVNALNAHMYRQLELDDTVFGCSNEAIARALEGGRQLTRAEISSVLEEAGIVARGQRLGYLVHRAELDALICSGARRGKRLTYALVAERAPGARLLARDEALAELTRRYFSSHGPATPQDFAWWSGLTVADAKAGLEMARPHIQREIVDGKAYWGPPSMRVGDDGGLAAHLLPPFDEYTIAHRDHSAILEPAHAGRARSDLFNPVFAIGGKVLGMWKRTLGKGEAIIERSPFRPLTDAEEEAFAAAARRFGDFLEMTVDPR